MYAISFMIDLGKGIEIVVETGEVSLEKLEESEFFLEDTTESKNFFAKCKLLWVTYERFRFI